MDWLVELVGEPVNPQTGKHRRGWALGVLEDGILMDGPEGKLRTVPFEKCRFVGMIPPGKPQPVFMVPPPGSEEEKKPDLLIMRGQHLKEGDDGRN